MDSSQEIAERESLAQQPMQANDSKEEPLTIEQTEAVDQQGPTATEQDPQAAILSFPNFPTAAQAAANGLLILSSTAAIANMKPNSTQPQNHPSFAFYYPQALAAAAAGMDPFTAMSNQLAAAARGMNFAGFPYPFPTMLQDGDSNGSSSKTKTEYAPTNAEIESLTPTQDGKYVCPSCGRAFSRMYNLKSHIRTHQNHRPFECPGCTMKFTRNHDLNRHLKTHSKDRPHVCSACGRNFARRDALRRHERMDPEGKKVHCVANANQTQMTFSPAVLAAAAAQLASHPMSQQLSQQMTNYENSLANMTMNVDIPRDDGGSGSKDCQ